jgi:hypothetical protein
LLHSFSTSALEGVGSQHLAQAALPRERCGPHCIVDWVGPMAGLDLCEKFRANDIRSPDRPAHSSVAIPTEMPSPQLYMYYDKFHMATCFDLQ